MAIWGERILAVGKSQDIARFGGESTWVVDARGGMLTPGLIDSHTYLPVPGLTSRPIQIPFRFMTFMAAGHCGITDQNRTLFETGLESVKGSHSLQAVERSLQLFVAWVDAISWDQTESLPSSQSAGNSRK